MFSSVLLLFVLICPPGTRPLHVDDEPRKPYISKHNLESRSKYLFIERLWYEDAVYKRKVAKSSTSLSNAKLARVFP